ncbi:hypothetical protein [Microbacterium testaceum]|uniref:hypothetical protein n=1 Tax=Microbacterium testaceum TaxID=2033 RepID=UPI002AC61A83|nr:hypothetical protein [Microbacterium testaceum]MDZ5146374.1 hypothetical protein [Microbacterium testaceum]
MVKPLHADSINHAVTAQTYTAAPPQKQPPRGRSTASMILGIVSIFLGFTLVIPLTGLILGIIGARKEPAGVRMAITGMILNGVVLAVVVAVGLLFLLNAASILSTGHILGGT